jgi:uncharacterized membrane protein
MRRNINFKFLFATALSFALINTVDLQATSNDWSSWLNTSNAAFARSSGGRGGGGSFTGSRSGGSSSSSSRSGGSSSSSSRSGGSSSSSSRSGGSHNSSSNRNSNPSYYQNNPGYSSGGNTVIVAPGGSGYSSGYSNSSHSSGFSIFPMLLVLGMFGVIALLIVLYWLRASKSQDNGSGFSSGSDELDNDTVTVSKVQVALLAQTTKGLQSQLSELTLRVDTNTPEGLYELLQESALLLLRNSENWSHVLASSQSLSLDKAEQLFNQLSLQKRSNFSAETLSNVGGTIRQQEAVIPGLEEDPAAYIVVTLLVGTAHDNPLFKDVRSAETLKEALERVASVSGDYLLKFELLWSPQVEEDSLTYDELLTEYTEMVQIA